jgi:hypothetical protein
VRVKEFEFKNALPDVHATSMRSLAWNVCGTACPPLCTVIVPFLTTATILVSAGRTCHTPKLRH